MKMTKGRVQIHFKPEQKLKKRVAASIVLFFLSFASVNARNKESDFVYDFKKIQACERKTRSLIDLQGDRSSNHSRIIDAFPDNTYVRLLHNRKGKLGVYTFRENSIKFFPFENMKKDPFGKYEISLENESDYSESHRLIATWDPRRGTEPNAFSLRGQYGEEYLNKITGFSEGTGDFSKGSIEQDLSDQIATLARSYQNRVVKYRVDAANYLRNPKGYVEARKSELISQVDPLDFASNYAHGIRDDQIEAIKTARDQDFIPKPPLKSDYLDALGICSKISSVRILNTVADQKKTFELLPGSEPVGSLIEDKNNSKTMP